MSSHQNTTTEVQKLRDAITLMDCLSQGGFSEIASIARLAGRMREGAARLQRLQHALRQDYRERAAGTG